MFAAKKSLGGGASPMLRTWIDIEQNGEKIQDEKWESLHSINMTPLRNVFNMI